MPTKFGNILPAFYQSIKYKTTEYHKFFIYSQFQNIVAEKRPHFTRLTVRLSFDPTGPREQSSNYVQVSLVFPSISVQNTVAFNIMPSEATGT